VSDTPRTDDAYFNRPDPSRYDLAGEMKIMERELNAANAIIRQQQLLEEENLRLQERIKRLEEAMESANTFLQLVMCEQNHLREVRNKANDRIKQLEIIISRASNRFFRNGSNGMVARGMLAILEEARKP